MMYDDLEATGHKYWIPIPLDVPPDALYQHLLERFRGTASEDSVANNASAMMGVANELRDPRNTEESTQNLAAWAMVREPDALEVHGFATLRASVIERGTTTDECIRGLMEDQPLYQDPVVMTMETMSGDATSLRYRPMVEDQGETQVHQVTAVLWPRPDERLLFTLTNYCLDLVEAAEIGDRLDELGAGIKGL
ncbi:MAG: hypothetical protein ACR2FG_04595 [Marmoricola sp.]